MENNVIENLLEELPELPGCYQFLDQSKKIIYIGKALNIKKRVQSYFKKQHLTSKQLKFINSIADIHYIIVHNNTEAMLLEQNLIKKHQPFYNKVMTDDKNYPYIAVTNEKYPRLVYLRKIGKNQKNAFGPFPDGFAAKKILNLLNQVFKFRKCISMPKQACLYYDLGQCLAPCVNKINRAIYDDFIKQVNYFFKGNTKEIIWQLNKDMQKYAQQLQFEKAQEIKELIIKVKLYDQHQTINFKDQINRDVIAIYLKDNYLALNIMFYRQGKLLHQKNFFQFTFDKGINEIINQLLADIYSKNILPKELLINYDIILTKYNESLLTTKIIIPRQGQKTNLIDLAKSNAYQYWRKVIIKNNQQENAYLQLTKYIKKILQTQVVNLVDIVDNSFWNQGTFVSAFIRYEAGVKNNNSFRRYNLNKNNHQLITNDYDAMKIAIKKHYVCNEKSKKSFIWPDILIVDGARIQVNAAREIKDKYNLPFTIIGLGKDEQHETKNLVLENGIIIDLNENLLAKRYLSEMQDTIHNFTINYYKKCAQISLLSSELLQIKGIGKKREKTLLNFFQSIEKIKKAEIKELCLVLPLQVAIEVFNYFYEKSV